jgi:hypothetical protein
MGLAILRLRLNPAFKATSLPIPVLDYIRARGSIDKALAGSGLPLPDRETTIEAGEDFLSNDNN